MAETVLLDKPGILQKEWKPRNKRRKLERKAVK